MPRTPGFKGELVLLTTRFTSYAELIIGAFPTIRDLYLEAAAFSTPSSSKVALKATSLRIVAGSVSLAVMEDGLGHTDGTDDRCPTDDSNKRARVPAISLCGEADTLEVPTSTTTRI